MSKSIIVLGVVLGSLALGALLTWFTTGKHHCPCGCNSDD